jgi:SAM-dependent methyltransferase
MSQQPTVEAFRPIAIHRRAGSLGRLLFAARMAADLQMLTCVRFLKPHLSRLTGSVLDVGCGEMPFRGLINPAACYTGLDVPQASDFGMRGDGEIFSFDGRIIPFPDASFDNVLCTEVLEHAEDPLTLIAEMERVLKPGGTLLATIPFSARVHYAPHDYHRFTRFRLAQMFASLRDLEISERGDDLAVIANKVIVVCMRLAKPSVALLWRLPILVLLIPLALLALGIAHVSLLAGWGSRSDPLGYAIRGRKPDA